MSSGPCPSDRLQGNVPLLPRALHVCEKLGGATRKLGTHTGSNSVRGPLEQQSHIVSFLPPAGKCADVAFQECFLETNVPMPASCKTHRVCDKSPRTFAEPPAGEASGLPRQTWDSRRDVVVGGARSLLAVPLVGRIYGVAVVHARYARVRALYAALISADPGMMVFHKRTSCWFPWLPYFVKPVLWEPLPVGSSILLWKLNPEHGTQPRKRNEPQSKPNPRRGPLCHMALPRMIYHIGG